MKHSLTLAIVFATISSAVFAQTPAPVVPQSTNTAPAAMPAPEGVMPPRGPMGAAMRGGMMGGEMKDRMGKHMDRMFDEMDANHDSSITKEESTAFANKKFEEHDTNHDAKVTKEEWQAVHEAKRKEFQEKMMQLKGDTNTAPTTPVTAPAGNAPAPVAVPVAQPVAPVKH